MAGAERMGQIIDALLALARLSRFETRREVIDLVPVAQTIVEQLRAAEPRRVVEFVAPDRLVARGDPQLLRVVLENLLGNAWKFTRQRSRARVEFGGSVTEEGPVYFVRDNGAGFDMAFVDKLFAPFQRLHSPDEFEGSGVGLATVHRIVRRHGGRVWADAAVDRGATFEFTLPIDHSGRETSAWPPRPSVSPLTRQA
jgi:signal transduction histidine kinase